MKYLASKKLAISLLIILALLSLIGMTLPQTDPGVNNYQVLHYPAYVAHIVDFLQLNRIFTSWWLKFVFALFLINLLACTLLQVRRALAQRTNLPRGPVYKSLSFPGSTGLNDKAAYFVSARGYKIWRAVVDGGPEIITGWKYGFSRWSGVVLHIGLLVLGLGILVSIITETDGIIPVMEGQQTTEDRANYVMLSQGIFSDSHTGLPIALNKISVAVDKKNRRYSLAKGELQFGEDILQFNHETPVESNGFTIYHDRLGYTLSVDLTGTAGLSRENDSAAFTFPLTTAPNSHTEYHNEITVPGSSYTLTARLYPNAVVKSGSGKLTYSSDGDALLNPLVYVSVMAEMRQMESAYLKKGESVSFGGLKLRITDIGYWSSFRLVKDHGSLVMYAGFSLFAIGLALTYLLVPKEIWIEISNDGNVRFGGAAGHYRRLFHDELDELIFLLQDGGSE